MKYWWGYLTAAIFAAFSWALMQMGQKYNQLVDMVYPYVTRSIQGFLAQWSGTVDVCVWQVAVVLFGVVVLAGLVLLIIFKGNIVRYIGWVLAVVSIVFFLHTGVYGLNYYAGAIEDDLRLEVTDYTLSNLEQATTYYRDQANALAQQMKRDANGDLVYSDFDTLAAQAGDGFDSLVLNRSFSIFAGDTSPVKKLGWSDMYSSMGITGFTCFLTGEAAVNPQTPVQGLPFTICHEMAHRMCVAQEDEANFSAYLACVANSSKEFQYSAYFMAYRYCYNALHSSDPAIAARVNKSCSPELLHDMTAYSQFFSSKRDQTATQVADTVNDTYLKVSGDGDGLASYGKVCDLLVNWYLSEFAPKEEQGVPLFDPYDETQVDLTGLPHAVIPETEATEPAA